MTATTASKPTRQRTYHFKGGGPKRACYRAQYDGYWTEQEQQALAYFAHGCDVSYPVRDLGNRDGVPMFEVAALDHTWHVQESPGGWVFRKVP
jgi:hypothetical protein